MNKSLLTLSLIPIASVMHTYGTSHVPDNRPNIILFLVDDMGWQDTSLPFGPKEPCITSVMKRLIWKNWLSRV